MDENRDEKEIIVPEVEPYTLVQNSIIQDNRLRLQTRAVYILMLSKPPEWDYSIRGMAKIAGVTRDTMRRFLEELEAAGYVARTEQPRKDGRFASGSFELLVSFTVRKNYARQEPTVRNFSSTKNSPQENKDNINNILPPIVPQGGQRAKIKPKWMPERFEALWKYYPRNENRKAAVRAWDKLRPSSELVDTMARSLKAQKQAWEKPGAPTPPHLSTWLNGERWEETVYVRQEAAAGDNGSCWVSQEVI